MNDVDQRSSSSKEVALAAGISFLADYGLSTALAVGIDVLRGRKGVALALARLACLGVPIVVVTTISKKIVQRERPVSADVDSTLLRSPRSSSFPSGHTLAATASAVALPRSAFGLVVGMTNAGAVGWARVRVGAHHRSDVLGGALLGGAVGLAVRPLLRSLDRRASRAQ